MTATAGARLPRAAPSAAAASADRSASEAVLRQELSDLRGLLALSLLMTSRRDEDEIVHVVVTAIPALVRVRCIGVRLVDDHQSRWLATSGAAAAAGVRATLAERMRHVAADGGPVQVGDEPWGWVLPLLSPGERLGYLVVAADRCPSPTGMLLLRSLGQQAGIALANARLHARNQRTNAELARSVDALRYKTAIHDALTQVAVTGSGPDGVVEALLDLTGLAACIETPSGDVVAWAGPGRPEPWPATGGRREQVLQRALRVGHPIRVDGRMLTATRPRPDVVGLLSLVDPEGAAGDQEIVALEHARTVLAIELSRLHSVAETELRLGRDLAADLLGGTGQDAHQRARALGYDLARPHRVVVASPSPRESARDPLVLAAQAAVADAFGRTGEPRPLVLQRASSVVALVPADVVEDGARLEALVDRLGTGARIGVGGRCTEPDQYPRALREAQVALRLAGQTPTRAAVLRFEDLGVYRLLAQDADPAGLDELVDRWLGPVITYDHAHRSELVATLLSFLDHGGSYDATAHALTIGRTTVRYRLRRVRELTGHDLADPETRFQVHLALKAWLTRTALA